MVLVVLAPLDRTPLPNAPGFCLQIHQQIAHAPAPPVLMEGQLCPALTRERHHDGKQKSNTSNPIPGNRMVHYLLRRVLIRRSRMVTLRQAGR